MMKFKKSIAFLITLAMFMTFALPVFAEVIPEATAKSSGYVFTDTKGVPLKLIDNYFPVSVGNPIKVQIKKDDATIADLGDLSKTIISSDEKKITISADGVNKNTFVINVVRGINALPDPSTRIVFKDDLLGDDPYLNCRLLPETGKRAGLWAVTSRASNDPSKDAFYENNREFAKGGYGFSDARPVDFVVTDYDGPIKQSITKEMVTIDKPEYLEFAADPKNREGYFQLVPLKNTVFLEPVKIAVTDIGDGTYDENYKSRGGIDVKFTPNFYHYEDGGYYGPRGGLGFFADSTDVEVLDYRSNINGEPVVPLTVGEGGNIRVTGGLDVVSFPNEKQGDIEAYSRLRLTANGKAGTITYVDADNPKDTKTLDITIEDGSGPKDPVYQFMQAGSPSTDIAGNKITISDGKPLHIQLKKDGALLENITSTNGIALVSNNTAVITAVREDDKTILLTPVGNGTADIVANAILGDYDDTSGAILQVTVSDFAEPEEPVDRNGLWFITGGNYNTGEDSFYHENNATNLVNSGSSTDVSNGKYEYDCVIADKNGKIGTSITSNMVTFGTEGVLEFAPDSQNKGFFKIIAIGNGTTTIEVVVDGKTYTTKGFTVTGVPKPEDISQTIDTAYIEKLTGNGINDNDMHIRLPRGVTITGTTDKVKIIDLADNEWGRDAYLVLPTSNPTSDETIELALSNGAKLIITLKANLNDYFLPMLKWGGGEYTPHLLGFHEFGDPKALTIEMFSNMTNPSYKMESTKGKTFTFVMNGDGKTITAKFDVAKDGYTELFGTFLIYTKTDKSDARQYPVTSIFSGQGNKGNSYHKDGDNSQVYWSESTYDKTTQTAFFTVAKFNSAYNVYWGKDADPKLVNNGDVLNVKYEIPEKYKNDNDLKNLSLDNGGVAKAGNYTLFGKEFKGVYGMKVSGIPENYTKPIYLKQTVTYNNITSNPPAVTAEFNNNFVYYVQLSDGYSNPENHVIDLAEEEYKDYTIQQAIDEGGENTTVKLKESTTYEENIAIPFYARIQGRTGSIIKAATNAPVITSTSSMRPVELYDVTIDGNNTSIGIETKGGGFVSIGDLNNPEKHSSTIKNCTVGVKVPKDGGVVNCTIKDNDIGIEFFQTMDHGLVAKNKVEVNGIGVKFTTGYNFGMPYGSFEAQHNIVKENTTKNVKAEIGDDKAEFRNNFIELGTDGIPKNIDGKPIIHPYFKTESMDTVTAKVDELTTTQNGEKEIPYITHDAMDNMAPTVDKQVFTDIMAITAKGRATVKPTPALIEGYSKDGIAYSFLINEITNPLDFNTRFDSKVAKPEIITASKAANGKNRPVSFKHNGEMPGKTVVTLSDTTGKYKAGDKLFLYLLNPTTNKLEFSGNVTVTEVNGVIYLTFVMDHCSDYLITDVDINAAPPVDNTTPAPPSYGGGSSVISSGDVANAISNAPNGTATIDITNTPIMSSESFSELAKSPNTTLVLKGDGYSWSFSGKDVSPYAQAIAFNTQISKYSPNMAQLTKVAGNAAFESVYFAFHGELPGKATVRVQTNFKNETVKLYYFNAKKAQFEYSGEAVVNSSGIAAFSITHCSDYILTRTALTSAVNNPKDTSTTPPSTGVDSYNWMNIIILIGMISIAAIIGVKKINVGN